MKKINKISLVSVLVVSLLFGLVGPNAAFAAGTTPSLGTATSFGILGSTYTNTSSGTTINGDLGYTTGPAMSPTVNGTTYIDDTTYHTAGSNQGTALTALNAQSCDFTYGSATDLSLLSQPLTPGVYCMTGAVTIGTDGITLNGSGTYIFQIDGALDSVAESEVSLTGGASACNVFWAPSEATTLGADSIFAGTVIDDAGITIGNNVTWLGRALSYGETISTDSDTITVPVCTGGLNVIKTVVNGYGGTASSSSFSLHVMLSGQDVDGSPENGAVDPGTPYTLWLGLGTYSVSEAANNLYTRTFSGACDENGNITLIPGEDVTCTVTNTQIPVLVNTGANATEGIFAGSIVLTGLFGASVLLFIKRKEKKA